MTDQTEPSRAAMEAVTVAEWVDRFYRRERLSREPGRRERIIADRTEDLERLGSAHISRHDSVTGTPLVLYDPERRPERYVPWHRTGSTEDRPDS